MKFQSYLPCQRLAPYVKHFVVSENSDAQTYKVLPGTSLVMGFQYTGRLTYLKDGTETKLATTGITGLMDGYRTFSNTANVGTVLVVFNETGASHFLRQPVNELFDESLSLDHFFDRDIIRETEDLLSMADDDTRRIGIVEQLLIRHLLQRDDDKLVNAAIAGIYQHKGAIRIADLARSLNTSQSPLEKRFRKVVGASPKKFALIVRAQNTLQLLKTDGWQKAVYNSGYYDQAHLIKEFKSHTGITPQQYMDEQQGG